MRAAPAMPVGYDRRITGNDSPASTSWKPASAPDWPNKPVRCGARKYVGAYSATAPMTAPASEPSPPMTGTARIDSESTGENWFGETFRHASAWIAPAIPAIRPETASIASFTVAGLTPNASVARSLSRMAMTRRPERERRRPCAAVTVTMRTIIAT